MRIPRAVRDGLLILGGFAAAFVLARILVARSSPDERSGRVEAERPPFDPESGCPIDPLVASPDLTLPAADPRTSSPPHPWRVAVSRQRPPGAAMRAPMVRPMPDEDEATPIAELVERDPVLKAMLLGSDGDPAELIRDLEAFRDYARAIRQDRTCLDAHGYLESGEGRLLELRLVVDDDERDPTRQVVIDTEVLGAAALADDADDLKRCLDGMFLGTHPPGRHGAGVGQILLRWVLTGNGIKVAPPTAPPGARLPRLP